jgi:acyl dehydratase
MRWSQQETLMTYIENRTYDEIKVSDRAELSRVLTTHDIHLFAIMSGDINPAHLDEEYAKNTIFNGVIAHGMWGSSLFSTVMATQLPGPGTIYLEQSLKFTKPVYVGDTVNITITVKEKKPKNRVVLDCLCSNQNGDTVISGEALVIALAEKVRRKSMLLPEIEFKSTNC